jgi:prepilin-type N-terminal cleavage/methylation domain-containing protein
MKRKMSSNYFKHTKENGFTLVELAIVMIIIGLLIGGILKGQELVESARINATVAQIKGIQAGIATFKDKYNALPGDMSNASTRIPGCAALPACNFNGNGDRWIARNNEADHAHIHLAAADLIAGVNSDGTGGLTNNFAVGDPDYMLAKIGNGVAIIISTENGANLVPASWSGTVIGGLTTVPQGVYASVFGPFGSSTIGLTPHQAYRIDLKLDDGTPGFGSIRARANVAANCGSTTEYLETNSSVACALHILVLKN